MDFRTGHLLNKRHEQCHCLEYRNGPDLKGFAAANGHEGKADDEVRAAMGDKFPKHMYHSIICIGALVAHQDDGRWPFIAAVLQSIHRRRG
jgi:hypothetical protein